MVMIPDDYSPSEEELNQLYAMAEKDGLSKEEIYNVFLKNGWIEADPEAEASFSNSETSENTEGENTEGDNSTSEKRTIYNSRNYDALQDFVKQYNDLVSQKEDLLKQYNNSKGYNQETGVLDEFKKNIDNINSQLKEMEDGDEFKELLQSVKDYGLGDKWNEDDSRLRYGVDNIINKRGSAIEKNNALKKFFLGSNMVSNTGKSMDDLIDGYLGNSKQGQSSNKESTNKSGGLKISSLEDRFKDTKMVDDMSFGGDVKSNEYLNRRNDILAKHLKANGIETPEEIEKYLNKYPSWKDAKQKWKDNTVSILADKVSKISHKNETPSKGEFGGEGWKENEDGSKTSPDGTTIVREDGSISFGTDDESPLNDVEGFGGKGWTKNKDGSKTSNDGSTTVYKDGSISFGADNESPLNDEELTGEDKESKKQTKKGKKVQSKVGNKKETKKIEKVSKSSPTILNLIKGKKK